VTPERWQQVKAMLAEVLQRAPADRTSYLDQVSSDPSLRREVEFLLAQEKGAEGFLEAPALEVAARIFGNGPDQSLIGAQIGPYQVLSLLGEGGMGEVYQAHDTKLGRDVAIKVLPAAFLHDAERLTRFHREARMLASLNHPNIATIHGMEHSDGAQYLVMELVPGQTLADRVSDGGLKIEEALQFAVQIAEALEAAHEKGVIHRDLKPANVKVTPEGRVKVLDFGLAKAFAGDGGLDLSNVAKLTAMGTEEGRILGTPAYMSPEQARGKPIDKRTDIWAFGCVFYELLTGRQAFRGETLSDTIAGVLEREADWQMLPAPTPTKIRDLLRRCLQKDPRRRVQDIGDARIEIEETLASPATAEPTAAAESVRSHWQGPMLWVVVSLLLVAAIAGLAIWNLRRLPSPQPVSRFTITLPPGQQFAGLDTGLALALSPDGTHLAYVALLGHTQQLYLRALDSLEANPIPETEGATSPFFSSDGQWVGFFADGKMKKVSTNGGAVQILADAPQPRGASWGSQGMVAFAPTGAEALQWVADEGGTPHPLTRFEAGEISHRWPEFLPGGKAVLFTVSKGGNSSTWRNAQIAVQSIGSGGRRTVISGGTYPRYASSGHLLYAHEGSLMAAPFDPQQLTATGKAVPVVDGVLQNVGASFAQYSFSVTGSLVYIPGVAQTNQSKLVWVSRNGAEQFLAAPARDYDTPALSPDGRRVAVGTDNQVWLYDFSQQALTRFTFEGSENQDPVWTPDGKRIAFESNKNGPTNVFWQSADGSGGPERLTTSEFTDNPRSWSPDGQLLAFSERNPTAGFDLWMLRLGDRKAQPFLRTPFNESAPRFSHDGRWLAYGSDESGRNEIYVQPYPGPGGKWQVSTEGGREPVWNPIGQELFYRSGDKMMAVDVTTQPSFAAGKPRVLFEGNYVPAIFTVPNYDVSPDGQRFLMIKPVEQAKAAPTQINVVLNWFEELKQKVPTAKK
jgi:serine/threonine protein kinase/Tol biopolymer transport system component